MNDPLITTLIPTYQRPQLLKRALKSVLNQAEKRFLIHVYDNASQDETSEMVTQFQKQDSRIHYFEHETNLGLFGNFKSCLSAITTPYFSFLSDDDFVFPWFYETALNEFTKYPDIGFAITRTLNINEKGQIDPFQVLNKFPIGYHKPSDSTFKVLEKNPIWTGIVYKTSILKKLNTLNPNVGNAFDIDFTLRASLHFPFSYVNKESACFVSWPKGASYFLDYYKGWLEYKGLLTNLRKENINSDLEKKLQKKEISIIKKLSLKDAIENKRSSFLPDLKPYRRSHVLFICVLRLPFLRMFLSLLRRIRKQLLFQKCKIKMHYDFDLKRIEAFIKGYLY